jgi:hypothetical protein
MRRYRLNWWAAPLVVAVASAACADLDVTNPNQPATDLVLAEPGDVQSLIADAYYSFWNGGRKSDNVMAASVLAGQHTSSWGNWGMWDVGRIPREPFQNTLTYDYRGTVTYPWGQLYSGAKSAYDGLVTINDGLVIVIDGTNHTQRARAFAKFVQGLTHAEIALHFDQGMILSETTPIEELADLPLVPYQDVMAFALDALDDALDLAQADFTIPSGWMRTPADLSAADFRRIVHAARARYTAAVARNPTERAAVDWSAVLFHTDPARTITQDYNVQGDGGQAWWSRQGVQMSFDIWSRAAYFTVGPADVSGAYAAWLNGPIAQRNLFDIVTPDRRIVGPAGGTDPGTHFAHWSTAPEGDGEPNFFNPARGSYFYSAYLHTAYDYFWLSGYTADQPEIMLAEIELLRAEALIRTGNPDAAVPLVNKYRAVGELPPVTAAGASGANCVPRLDGTTCANLMEAMQYEKRLMAYASGGSRIWSDARGWGDIVEGSIIHFPVPAAELAVLQLPNYTKGGLGQPGGYPNP